LRWRRRPFIAGTAGQREIEPLPETDAPRREAAIRKYEGCHVEVSLQRDNVEAGRRRLRFFFRPVRCARSIPPPLLKPPPSRPGLGTIDDPMSAEPRTPRPLRRSDAAPCASRRGFGTLRAASGVRRRTAPTRSNKRTWPRGDGTPAARICVSPREGWARPSPLAKRGAQTWVAARAVAPATRKRPDRSGRRRMRRI